MDRHTSEFAEAASRLFAGDETPVTNPLFGLGVELLSEFVEAEALRKEAEDRWLMDLRQYRGIYEPDEEARMKGSKAFMRKTRVKVESVDARMLDMLFPANREQNYEIKATPEPSIPSPLRKKIIELLTEMQGGVLPDKETLKKAIKESADNAALKMSTRIKDQLAEVKYRNVARKVLHSGNLYGTGVLKGPLVERRERVSYVWSDEENRFRQERAGYSAPFIADVPLWRWYPDMAVTELQHCRYVWEHHRLSRSDLVSLIERKTFNGETIRSHLLTNPDGDIRPRTYEAELREMGEQKLLGFHRKTGQFDVFERWGWIAADKLRGCGVEIPDDRLHEAFFANIWVLPDGQVIKAVLQPIEGMLWPYHLYYLDKDETSIFGEGLATIMRGDQQMLNAALRMLLDNAAVTAGPQFEVFVPAFPANANLTDIHPLKVWPRTGGDFQYPAVRQLDFNSRMPELIQVLQLFDTNADEVTAIPKFTYGDNPTQGAAGTMGGLSMLLGQANISLKDLVISWDEGITKPFISGLFHWNMKFSTDDTIKGDFDIEATGAASLVAKEVRGQSLAQFSATLQPEERARVNWGKLTQQKANTLDLTDIVMDDEEFAQVEQQQAQQMEQQMQQQQQLLQLQAAELQAKAEKTMAEAQKIAAEAQIKMAEAQMMGAGGADQAAQIRAEFAQREQEAFMRVQEQMAGLKQDYAEQVMKAQNEIAMLKQALANKDDLARAEIEKAMIAAQSQERQAEIRRESEITREQIRAQSQEQIAQMEARVSMMLKQMEDRIGAVQDDFVRARDEQQQAAATRQQQADQQAAAPAAPMVLNIQVDAKPAGSRSIEFQRDANGKVVGAKMGEAQE